MKTDIKIFNIGRTTADPAEVRRWLDHLGVSQDFQIPDGEVLSAPALLVALAAKRCYNSFEVNPDLNPNVTRIRKDWGDYLDNILQVGHGSVLEHSVYTWAIEGVSRVFTAEMNRHRAGWGVSEGSLRFIRFGKELRYWEPDLIQGPEVFADGKLQRALEWLEQDDPPAASVTAEYSAEHKRHLTRAVIERAFERQRHDYALLEKIWGSELEPESPFQQKKELTSLFRRIIGMGCATGGVWTGNLRALRHVITMRCAEGAEEEIRHVFVRILEEMQRMEPHLFGDFHKDTAGFWRPTHVKV